ncbi:hypothetical protein [Microbulbifer sp. VAAF005]|uniref:hypothetical protein n=1 Tax=Microbulbifer sp. VAAF005 TaxID=3034230 RepID=UPI0024AC9FE3|nr:hypothetical protein [Microbulbifer sp. VAAF005]WHI45749.1 hypothetical protein P0078_18785 [Microbulbifer sp. VAAF005]
MSSGIHELKSDSTIGFSLSSQAQLPVNNSAEILGQETGPGDSRQQRSRVGAATLSAALLFAMPYSGVVASNLYVNAGDVTFSGGLKLFTLLMLITVTSSRLKAEQRSAFMKPVSTMG